MNTFISVKRTSKRVQITKNWLSGTFLGIDSASLCYPDFG